MGVMGTPRIEDQEFIDADPAAEFHRPSYEDHLQVGLVRAGLTGRAGRKPSRRRRAGLGLVGDVQDISAVLDVLDRRR